MPRSASNPGMQPARYGPSAGMPGRPGPEMYSERGPRATSSTRSSGPSRGVPQSSFGPPPPPQAHSSQQQPQLGGGLPSGSAPYDPRDGRPRGQSNPPRRVIPGEDRAGLVVAAAWARQCRAAQQRMRAALSPMDASTIRHAADRFLLRAVTAAAATSEAFSRARSSSTPVAPSRARSSNDLARQQASLLGRSCRLGKVRGLGACIIHRSRIRARREGPGRFLLQDHQGWGILADTALAQNSARPGLWAHFLRAGSFNRHPEATRRHMVRRRAAADIHTRLHPVSSRATLRLRWVSREEGLYHQDATRPSVPVRIRTRPARRSFGLQAAAACPGPVRSPPQITTMISRDESTRLHRVLTQGMTVTGEA